MLKLHINKQKNQQDEYKRLTDELASEKKKNTTGVSPKVDEVLKKQVEQNQKEYFKVVEENDALKKNNFQITR